MCCANIQYANKKTMSLDSTTRKMFTRATNYSTLCMTDADSITKNANVATARATPNQCYM